MAGANLPFGIFDIVLSSSDCCGSNVFTKGAKCFYYGRNFQLYSVYVGFESLCPPEILFESNVFILYIKL